MNTNLHQTAVDILEYTKIVDLFSKLGRVEIIGSLRLNLMYRRDIDLLVIADEIQKAQAEAITQTLQNQGHFQKVICTDYQTNPVEDMPLGFYWELHTMYQDQDWKFDIWYLKPDERYTKMVFESLERFERTLAEYPEKAGLILKIKAAYFDGIKYRNNLTGFAIYTAVLEQGVNSLEDFQNIIKI